MTQCVKLFIISPIQKILFNYIIVRKKSFTLHLYHKKLILFTVHSNLLEIYAILKVMVKLENITCYYSLLLY